jgi:hypothetical protein
LDQAAVQSAATKNYFSSLPFKQDKTIHHMLEKVAKVLPGHSYGH